MKKIQVENKLTGMARTNIVINRVLFFDGGAFYLHEESFRLVQFPSLVQSRKRSDVLDFEGARQFYGTKVLNGNCYLYEILYDYEKNIESKCYGLQDYVADAIPYPATYKYIETLVSLNGFEKEENATKKT
ncbi:hypothetical protein AG4045_006577 [Apium graveolens]|uniref:Uncharacterized protein n=1 Tax=Apium graveolens TaxID=4045 RepID=A0A6L5BF91_APIGR|nr:hypothetical protein AG4045_006577 [Apium graveolens]